jgi:TonB-linked SusC/RagA family outer membrane protein
LWNNGLETHLDFSLVENLVQNGINFNPEFVYWREYNQNTDWLGEITRNAMSSETNLSLEGGGERATYRFSTSFLTELGTTLGTDYNRLNATLYLTYRFANNFRVNTEVGYSQGNRNASHNSDIRTVAMRKMSNMSPYVMQEDGIHRTSIYFTPESSLQGSYSSTYNPVAMAREATRNSNNRNIRLALNLDYDMLQSLKYYGSFAFTINTSDEHAFLPQVVTGVRKTNENYNRSSSSTSDNTSLYMNNKVIFNKTFSRYHQVTATGIFDLQTNASANYGSAVSGGATDNIPSTVVGGVIRTFTSGSSRSKQIGFTGNLHYAYDNRYLLQMNYNYGAQSRMNPTNRWKGFPSVGVSWRAENEPFMESLKEKITSLKFRLSWGLNGKAPGGTFPSAGRFTTESNYGTQGAVGPSTMDLTKLRWEIVEKWNTGAEIELRDGRYFLSFDWYRNITKDLLQRNVSVPSHTGYTTVSYFNSGKMSNEGWELRGNIRNISLAKDLKFGMGVNLSTNINTIMELPENVDFFQYPENATNQEYAQAVSEGHPMGAFYGFRCLGVYKDSDAIYSRDKQGNLMYDVSGTPIHMRHEERFVLPGDAIYEDVNNDGMINKYDIVYLGNAMPEFTGGLSLSLEYKGWRLNSDFHYRLKYNVINKTQMQLERMYNYDNQSVTVLNRWRHEGDMTTIPKALYNRGYNTLGSNRFVEEGSYLRMKSLTLSYSLPRDLITRWGLKQCSFSATGYDIFTWTDYSGQDPEVSINGGIDQNGNFILIGVDNAQTPRPRKVSLNMTVKF